jgi:uncharacterized repeat protein (TIGR02543 family)
MATWYTYTLKYNANGGSGAPSTQSYQTSRTSYTFTISSNEPSRTGYRFGGWANGPSGGVAWLPGEQIELNDYAPSHTLYAFWTKRTYTVSYNANGGSGAPSSQTKTYGEALTLRTGTPSRAGYTFEGWATSPSGGVAYSPGDTYTDNAAVTLYAVWDEDTPTYTVRYNANGGSGAPGNQTKIYGVTLVLSSVVPTYEDREFVGWGASADATTPIYQPGANYTANAGITLYAIWSDYEPPTGAMYIADGDSVSSGDPYIVKDTPTQGTAFIVINGVVKEGK